jgi:hypothetical protein
MCVSLDDYFFGRERVDVVKIDAEGAEPLAVRGMESVLRGCRAMTLVVEQNARALQAAGMSWGDVSGPLGRLGFREMERLDCSYSEEGVLELCNVVFSR